MSSREGIDIQSSTFHTKTGTKTKTYVKISTTPYKKNPVAGVRMYYMIRTISTGLKPSNYFSDVIQTIVVEALQSIYPNCSADLQLSVSASQPQSGVFT